MGRELFEGLSQEPSPFDFFECGARWREFLSEGFAERLDALAHGKGPPPLPSEMIDGQVVGDAQEPGAEGTSPIETIQRREGTKKHVMGQVFDGSSASENAPKDRGYASLIVSHHRTQDLRTFPACSVEELILVVEGVQRSSRYRMSSTRASTAFQ